MPLFLPAGGRDHGSLVASSVSSLMGGRGARNPRGLEVRELLRALLGLAVMVGSGPAALQLAPLMALGHTHSEHYQVRGRCREAGWRVRACMHVVLLVCVHVCVRVCVCVTSHH